MRPFKVISFISIFLVSHAISDAQNCTLTCPANIVTKADSGQEGALVSFPPSTSLGAGDCGTITYSRLNGSFFRIGSHSVTATTSTREKCAFTITVTDNESPTLSPLILSSKKLWPASNKMKRVAVYYSVSDNGKDVNTILSVNSNATDGIKDWELTNNHLLRLKASRLPDGTPRVYTITVTATDDAGNKTIRNTSIAVSKTIIAVAAM